MNLVIYSKVVPILFSYGLTPSSISIPLIVFVCVIIARIIIVMLWHCNKTSVTLLLLLLLIGQ